jgi:ribosome-binding factor A
MTTRRIARLTEAIREQVSTSILFELKDPRVGSVTVTRVEVAPDAQSAKVYMSVLGDEKAASRSLHGLNSARGFLQARVAARVKTRYTPILTFVLDPGIKRSAEVSQILHDVLPSDANSPPDSSSESEVGGRISEVGKSVEFLRPPTSDLRPPDSTP